MSQLIVGNVKSSNLPRGDHRLAWKKLEIVGKRWDPKTREVKVDLLTKFMKLRMQDVCIKPED